LEHLEQLWKSGNDTTLEQASLYLSAAQAVHLWTYAQSRMEGKGLVYLLFSTGWGTAKQLLLSLKQVELEDLIKDFIESHAQSPRWYTERLNQLFIRQKGTQKELLEAVQNLKARLQESGLEKTSRADLQDVDVLIDALELEQSALKALHLSARKLTNDTSIPVFILEALEALAQGTEECRKLQRDAQSAREAHAFHEDEEELYELLPRWGVWSFEECKGCGLLATVAEDDLPRVATSAQHFVKACAYLNTLGIHSGDDLKKLGICNIAELTKYLKT